MLPSVLRRLISIIGCTVAIITTIAVPIGYGWVAYQNEADNLAFKARLNAARVSKYIYTHGSMWTFHRVRLAELIELTEAKDDAVRQRIYDLKNKLVLEEGPRLVAPTFARAVPILVSGEPAGRMEVEASAWPFLANLMGVAGGSALLGLLIVLALRTLPLRLLDQTFETLSKREEELATQNTRFEAALDNMPQGLCMFDSSNRLLVCNTHYATMYRLTAVETEPGTPLRTILERRVAAGVYPKDEENYIARVIERVSAGKPYRQIGEQADGRFIAAAYEPMSGGSWVAVHQDITEQKRAEEKIAYMAHHDALTGLPNRVLLRDQLTRHLSNVKRGASLAVLCLDLDYFKQVNDTLGHPIGDALLCAVSTRLSECIRDTDFVARLGGDEFAIIQTDVEQPTSASALANRVVEAMAKPFNLDGHEIVIGTSVGISVAPNDSMEPDALLKNADMALYRAKDHGRNGFSFFEVGMDTKMHERRTLETDLRRAIAVGEFELFYQPIMNLEHETISGFEALVRWNHPTRGIVAPAAFIPLAEETGLIIPIGEWVLREACNEASKWPDDIKVAVNLSPVQFRNKNLVPVVTSALANSGISPNRLELEITETVMLQNTDSTLAVLHMLQGVGVLISMDDFGTGYSSLNYLRSFPFNKIKIDQSFVRDLDKGGGAIAIIHAVSGLGKSFGMVTTVEGVETRDQLEQVRSEGCTEVQGYFFSKPQPACEVPRLLSTLGRKSRVAA
jgi:diguanylate cyclase (GGDEF)-like protein